jgi:glycosyltransferase involved in cell wall biosynthesis
MVISFRGGVRRRASPGIPLRPTASLHLRAGHAFPLLISGTYTTSVDSNRFSELQSKPLHDIDCNIAGIDATWHYWNHIGGGHDVIDRNELPLVSVIIPTYNRAQLLSRAVRSVLDQTYQNLEITIVDDASSDQTGEILKQFRDPRIKYLRHEENKGGSASRNTGIRVARGKYIGFLDDDDEWMPSKLECQVEHLENNGRVDVVYTGLSVRDLKSGKRVGKVVPQKKGVIFGDLLGDNYVGTTSSVLIRRERLEIDNLFDEGMPSCQDWDMWLNLSKKCMFDYIQEPMVIYHIHEERITTYDESALLGRKMIFEKYKDEIMSNRVISGKHHLMIGSLYCRLGDMKRGREEIRRSIQLRPNNVMGFITYFASLFGAKLYSILYRFTPAKCKWWIVRSAV